MDFIFMLTRGDKHDRGLPAIARPDRAARSQACRLQGCRRPPKSFERWPAPFRGVGATSYMEVVSTTPEACLNSARVARDLGIDRCSAEPRSTKSWTCSKARTRNTSLSRASRGDIRQSSAARPADVEADCRPIHAEGCAGADLLAYRATEAEPARAGPAARRGLGSGSSDRRGLDHDARAHPRDRRPGPTLSPSAPRCSTAPIRRPRARSFRSCAMCSPIASA